MENRFWTSIAIPLIIGIIILLLEYLVVQPLAKKSSKSPKDGTTLPKTNKGNRKNPFASNTIKRVISWFALIPPKNVILAMAFFLFGVIFTIIIANMTNTNLATLGIYSQEATLSRLCGNSENGIVGRVIYYDNGIENTYITTSPPTSSVISDDKGYFYICNIAVDADGQEYTINALNTDHYTYTQLSG